MTARTILLILKLVLFVIWPYTCWAASITLSQTVGQITLADFSTVLVLSTLSGATALVMRIDRELKANPGFPLPRPYLFCAAHMLGSWLAGVLAFFMCERVNVGDWEELMAIALAAFGGSKFIELVLDRYLSKLTTKEKTS